MNPKAIFFLDAGRKFFSVKSICTLLEAAAQAGLDQMQLYFSDNQGFRFALADMTVETEYGTYDLSGVPGDGYCQEDKAPDGSGGYLTEGDMEAILGRAAGLGIELVPALNMPGHMGTILTRFPQFRYPGSRSSLDLRNPEAVAFAYGLAEKYAAWFARRGCRYFNLGGDEFANDLGTMGFETIYENGVMRYFVDFLNGLVGRITAYGLTPMAFNDGIYYNDDLAAYGEIDRRIWVLYWIAGWNGYRPASPATLARAGFSLVNACHRYYCGAGCPDWAERAENWKTFDCRRFDRDTIVDQPAGGMLCCWCDRGNFYGPDGGEALAHALPPVIAAFGQAMGKTNC